MTKTATLLPRSHGFSTEAADRLRPPSDTRALITTDYEVILPMGRASQRSARNRRSDSVRSRDDHAQRWWRWDSVQFSRGRALSPHNLGRVV